MQLTPEQITSVKGLINNYLFDLEQDIKGQARSNEEVALAIRHVMDPVKYPVSEALAEDLAELKGSFEQPQLLLNFFKRANDFVYDEQTILPEIKGIMLECLQKALNEKAPEPAVLVVSAAIKVEVPAQVPEPAKAEVPALVAEPAKAVVAVVEPKHHIDADIIGTDLTNFPDTPIESLLLFYPANSADALRTFIAINLQFQKYNLPSYKVLGQEHTSVFALRGTTDEVISIDLTPHMTRAQCLKLLDHVRGLDKPWNAKDRYNTETIRSRTIYNINFHFDKHHCPLVMNADKVTINHAESLKSFRQQIEKTKTRTTCQAPSQAAINLLLMHEIEKWCVDDVEAAQKLLRDSRETGYGKNYITQLSLVDLENAIGIYYETHKDFQTAKRTYENAYNRLTELTEVKKSQGITIDPYLMGIQVKNSQEKGQQARRLSSCIVICMNLIDITLQFGATKNVREHICKLYDAIQAFKTVQRYGLLKLTQVNGETQFTKSHAIGIFDQDMLHQAQNKMQGYAVKLSNEAEQNTKFTLDQFSTALKIDRQNIDLFCINWMGDLEVRTASQEQATNLEDLLRLEFPKSGGLIKKKGHIVEISKYLFPNLQEHILGKAIDVEDSIFSTKSSLKSTASTSSFLTGVKQSSVNNATSSASSSSFFTNVTPSTKQFAVKNATKFDLDKFMQWMQLDPNTVVACLDIDFTSPGVEILMCDSTHALDLERRLREALDDVSKSKYGFLIKVQERDGHPAVKINWDAYKDLNLKLSNVNLETLKRK